MTDSMINPDLLKKLKDLDSYFFDVLNRAEKTAKANGKLELGNNDVKNVLAEDMNFYLNANSPTAAKKLANVQDNLDNTEKAEKLIELAKKLDPILAVVAGLGGPRLDLEFKPQQQAALRGATQGGSNESNVLTHPKLEKFLDQAASSFLDAFRKIQEEHQRNQSNDPNKEPSKDFDNVLENVKKLLPAFKFEQAKPKPEAPKSQPQYVPTMTIKKPSPF